MRKKYLHKTISFLFFLFPLFHSLFAQTGNQELTAAILHKDSLFWTAYNHCNTENFGQFFTQDVEFYHDKGGITLGLEKLTANTKTNLCSNNNFRLRRAAVEGTVKVFPLHNAGVIYGAIISGEHVFFVQETGKKERLDGLAKFSHVWLLKDSVWKMARILSYDHGPAQYTSNKKEIILSGKVIDAYIGKYKGVESGTITIEKEKGFLILSIQNKKFTLYPEADNRFFMKERDVSFEFIKNEKNKVIKMLVREQENIVEEAVAVTEK